MTAVVGLDNRPQAEPRVRKIHPRTVSEALTEQPFSPLAIGQMPGPTGQQGQFFQLPVRRDDGCQAG